jgi:primosomal protein N' (replication factor Y)
VARSRLTTPSLFEPPVEDSPAAVRPARPVPTWGLFARVALNRPVRREFTYAVPAALAARARVGARVAVPFGSKRFVGVVVALEEESEVPAARLKEVLLVLDEQPVVGLELLGLTRWISERYACAWGEALAAVLPAPLKRERARRRVPFVQAVSGVGDAELEELKARFPEQHRLLRTLIELGEPTRLRDVLRSLRLSESPARTLRKRGWVSIEMVPDEADPLATGSEPARARTRPEVLSEAQSAALERIRSAIAGRQGRTFLLHGVTGSGKTEVYLRAIEEARARDRGAIVLVPEIALTPQTVGWFRSRFGEVSVLHSRMSDAQRLGEWRRLQEGRVRVVVGARSAIFAPVADLGVIVVDEEHEPSFKQESVPRYHARDVAVERARRCEAVCLLGSATPSLEAWDAARRGRFERLELPVRVGGGRAASVQIVDLRLEGERSRAGHLFSRSLTTFLAETLESREQAILFLNRRGFVPVLWCPGCERTLACGQCSTALTFHRRIQRLVCHSCCDERDVPESCPTCSRPRLRALGVGSERVEAELRKAFPTARVARMDSDTMKRREDYERCLAAFERHELDVLVGTQMIAKGLDFPRVTLVGVLDADLGLHLPDLRAAERTFQLIAQVSGRAGRGALPGRVIVQTRDPEHPAVRLGASGDFETFARGEDEARRALLYPPHARLVRVLLEDTDEARVQAGAQRCAEVLAPFVRPGQLEVLGPVPAPFALLRGRHRHHLLVKAARDAEALDEVLAHLVDLAARETRPAIKIDVDPMSML